MFGNKVSVLKKVEPNEINQGQLGDCYFLCALSVLAQDPELIKARFVTKEKNAAGIYCVKFLVNGEDYEVVVDDYFPCDPRFGMY